MTAVSIETIQPDPAVIFDDATAALDEDFDDDTDFTGDDDDIDDVPAQRGRSREPSYIDLRDAAVLRMAPDLPADQAGLDTVAREAFEAFHAAVVIGDESAMMAASIRYDAVVWKLNGGAFFACEAGNEAVSPRLRARLAAAPGAVPLWGQSGEFLVDHAGIRGDRHRPRRSFVPAGRIPRRVRHRSIHLQHGLSVPVRVPADLRDDHG